MAATYTIGTLAGITGLSAHTIRAWERRYQALSPSRSETNRRVYGEEDLSRLSLLKRVVESGHSIGQVAHLTVEELSGLDHARPSAFMPASDRSPDQFLTDCLASIDKLDPEALHECLVMASANLGVTGLIDKVIVPLIGGIESGWLAGEVKIAQEHMASAVLRSFLEGLRTSIRSSPGAPKLLVTTPINQHHELGALIAAVVAAMHSWNVTYLGPNLPAREIADAVKKSGAKAVALSIVFPRNDAEMARDLALLGDLLPASISIMAGGRAVSDYQPTLQAIRAKSFTDLDGFRQHLQS